MLMTSDSTTLVKSLNLISHCQTFWTPYIKYSNLCIKKKNNYNDVFSKARLDTLQELASPTALSDTSHWMETLGQSQNPVERYHIGTSGDLPGRPGSMLCESRCLDWVSPVNEGADVWLNECFLEYFDLFKTAELLGFNDFLHALTSLKKKINKQNIRIWVLFTELTSDKNSTWWFVHTVQPYIEEQPHHHTTTQQLLTALLSSSIYVYL